MLEVVATETLPIVVPRHATAVAVVVPRHATAVAVAAAVVVAATVLEVAMPAVLGIVAQNVAAVLWTGASLAITPMDPMIQCINIIL